MKNYYSLIVTCGLLTGVSNAQNTTTLNENNVSAELQDEGFLFNDIANSNAGYEVPAGTGKNLIYSSSFWVGGTDINGQLKLAAQRYKSVGQDYWAGPLTRFAANDFLVNPFGQTIWSVTKAEIDYHQLNYSDPSYVMPADIQNWPVIGDSSFCTDSSFCEIPYYAPFVDADNDGEYHPELGDYPCIKGDKAVYMISNDKGNLHDSGGEPIGVEMRYMIYQFSSVPELADVTFIDLEIMNAGTQTIYDFRSSYFLDADVGNPNDDFVGCDTTRNMIYAYNGDVLDEFWASGPGYGVPPALGIVSLNNDMSSSSFFISGGGVQQQDPNVSPGYYNVMDGSWRDGSDKFDGDGNVTPYMFYGDPSDGAQWSEVTAGSAPGDRRMVISNSLGTLTPSIGGNPNGSRNLSYAIISAQGTDNLNSVSKLFISADYVQTFFDGLSDDCFDETIVNVNELEIEEVNFALYPNPSSGTVNISFNELKNDVAVEVTDLSGRVVAVYANTSTDSIVMEINETAGVYLVHVSVDGVSSTKRLIIE